MRITTLPALQSLQDETMVYAAITGAVALALSILVASLVAAAGFYVYNDLVVKPDITNAGWQSMFSDTNLICIGINLGVYIVGGIILMFVFRHKKFGSILGKEKNA